MTDHIEDHDRGLAFDLATLQRQRVGRRRALSWLAGGSAAAVLAGCDSSGATETSAESVVTPAATPTPTPASTPTPTPTSSSSACVADPQETAGPYPGDGTNSSSGSTSNVLTQSGIMRADLRRSFLTTTNDAGGVVVVLKIKLVNVNNACAALAGYPIYLWHCDRNGHYSLYTAAAESWLRGVQVTDSNGEVTFTTYFPGGYDGRFPHMHFEIFASVAAATSGRNALLTSQFAMPAAAISAVYAVTSLYPTSAANAGSSTSSDMVFGDNSAAQIAAMTPTFTGDPTGGYSATATVGIAV